MPPAAKRSASAASEGSGQEDVTTPAKRPRLGGGKRPEEVAPAKRPEEAPDSANKPPVMVEPPAPAPAPAIIDSLAPEATSAIIIELAAPDATSAIGDPRAPLGPVKPAQIATNSDWATYYEAIAKYVTKNLTQELLAAGVDIREYGELHHVPTANIKKNTKPAIGGVTTYKETWNVERCQLAMQSTGKYAAAGSLWWFSLCSRRVVFKDLAIFESVIHRAGVEAASVLWDDAAFQASDLQAKRRRFNFPGDFPTACPGLAHAKQKLTIKGSNGDEEDVPTFKNLPLLAGRQCVLAFFEAMAFCMASKKETDKDRLKKLFEARGRQRWTGLGIYPFTVPFPCPGGL